VVLPPSPSWPLPGQARTSVRLLARARYLPRDVLRLLAQTSEVTTEWWLQHGCRVYSGYCLHYLIDRDIHLFSVKVRSSGPE
jgi:hypothetical protein